VLVEVAHDDALGLGQRYRAVVLVAAVLDLAGDDQDVIGQVGPPVVRGPFVFLTCRPW
jgi:hypothetical protein